MQATGRAGRAEGAACRRARLRPRAAAPGRCSRWWRCRRAPTGAPRRSRAARRCAPRARRRRAPPACSTRRSAWQHTLNMRRPQHRSARPHLLAQSQEHSTAKCPSPRTRKLAPRRTSALPSRGSTRAQAYATEGPAAPERTSTNSWLCPDNNGVKRPTHAAAKRTSTNSCSARCRLAACAPCAAGRYLEAAATVITGAAALTTRRCRHELARRDAGGSKQQLQTRCLHKQHCQTQPPQPQAHAAVECWTRP